jgi:hypothetical protein
MASDDLIATEQSARAAAPRWVLASDTAEPTSTGCLGYPGWLYLCHLHQPRPNPPGRVHAGVGARPVAYDARRRTAWSRPGRLVGPGHHLLAGGARPGRALLAGPENVLWPRVAMLDTWVQLIECCGKAELAMSARTSLG